MHILETGEGFVVVGKPGRYQDRKAATYAAEFSDEELKELESPHVSEYITYKMLVEKAKQRNKS